MGEQMRTVTVKCCATDDCGREANMDMDGVPMCGNHAADVVPTTQTPGLDMMGMGNVCVLEVLSWGA